MAKSKYLILLVAALLVSVLFIGGCLAPADGDESAGGFDWTWIIILVLFVAMLYFVMIRPQQRRQKEQQNLIQQLQKGDRIVTTGGIYGVIESVSEDSVVIRVESGATMRVAKGGVAVKRET